MVRKLVILFVVVVLITTGCSSKSKQFSELYNGNSQNVTQLEIIDGRTGQTYKTQDKAEIEEFLKIIGTRSFSKEFSQSARVGYLYYVDLYEGSKKTSRLTFSGDVQFDTIYYNIDKDITNDLDSYFESLKSK